MTEHKIITGRIELLKAGKILFLRETDLEIKVLEDALKNLRSLQKVRELKPRATNFEYKDEQYVIV